MRGLVRKRGTTWTWYLDAPPDPLTGKRRQASKGGFRTKREAQQELNEALARLRDGTFVQPSPAHPRELSAGGVASGGPAGDHRTTKLAPPTRVYAYLPDRKLEKRNRRCIVPGSAKRDGPVFAGILTQPERHYPPPQVLLSIVANNVPAWGDVHYCSLGVGRLSLIGDCSGAAKTTRQMACGWRG